MIMTIWCLLTLLIISLLIGVVKLLLEKNAINRFLVIQLMGTTIVAIFILFACLQLIAAENLIESGILDLALSSAILAAITITAFVQRGWSEK